MAVYNGYVDANLAAGKIGNAALIDGVGQFTAIQSFVIAAADSAGSIYRVFKEVPSDAIVIGLDIMCDAVPGVTAALVGLYSSLSLDGIGAIIGSGNQLNAGVDISSAITIATGWTSLLTGLAIANREKQLWELAGQTEYPGPIASLTGPKANSYDICLTCPSMTTNTANITMRLRYLRGV